jgi:hypothetical protein
MIAFGGKTVLAAVGRFGSDMCSITRLSQGFDPDRPVVIAAYGTPRLIAAVEECYAGKNDCMPTYDNRTETYFGVIVTRSGTYTCGPVPTSSGVSWTAQLEHTNALLAPSIWFPGSRDDAFPAARDCYTVTQPTASEVVAYPLTSEELDLGLERYLPDCEPDGADSIEIVDVTDIFPGF